MTKFDKWFKSFYGDLPLKGPAHSALHDRQTVLERELLEVTASLTTAYRFDRDYCVAKRAWGTADWNAKHPRPTKPRRRKSSTKGEN